MGTRNRARMVHLAALVVLTGLISVVADALTDGKQTSQRLSLGLGYASLVWLLTALVVGPLRVLRGRPNPLSNDLRRDIGIAAAVCGIVHVAFAVQHHLGGDVLAYVLDTVDDHGGPLRLDRFGTANNLGVLASLVLVVLLATSNDWALRRLRRTWKRLQRSNYLLAPVVVAHTVVFWSILARAGLVVALVLLAVAVVLALQVAGFVTVRRRA